MEQRQKYFPTSPASDHAVLERLATLGLTDQSPTCSMFVARTRFPESIRVPAPTYEAAAKLVLEHRADALLVAAAYPKIGAFYMDDRLAAIDAFLEVIPALVVVCRSGGPVERLYLHPATRPLVPRIELEFGKLVDASSNDDAVNQMLNENVPAAAITNALVAQQHRLPVLQTLREGRPMGWALFNRTSVIGKAEANE